MYYPTIFDDDFTDDFFDDVFDFPFFNRRNGRKALPAAGRMSTDVREYDDRYELAMELPGYDKKDIKIDLKDGYLGITAEHTDEKKDDGQDAETEDGKYIRRERFYGKMQRSFYVGKDVKGSDIKASFENGVLKLSVPKVQEQPKVEQKNYIPIEG